MPAPYRFPRVLTKGSRARRLLVHALAAAINVWVGLVVMHVAVLDVVLVEHVLERALLLDLLPQVCVAGEVDPLQRRDAELECDDQQESAQDIGPPAELRSELVREAAADKVRDLGPSLEDGGEDELVDEPAEWRPQKSEECDNILAVQLENTSTCQG